VTNRLLTPADKMRLGITGLALVIFLLAQPFSRLKIEWPSFCWPYFLIAVLAAVGLAYRGLNRDKGIAAACFAMAQILLFSNLAELDNYLGLTLHRPLIDEYLAGIDRTIGIEWWAYVNWVKTNPFLGRVLTCAYISSIWQLAAIILFLGFTRRFARLDRLTLAFVLSGSMTIAFWVVFPNFGALALHSAKGLPEPAFNLSVSKNDALQLLALYAGPVPPLRFSDLTGLIGFPSFHTVMAFLTVQAAWKIPFAGLAALAGNILVLLAIPADGGHHFVDIAGGFFVALVSTAFADAFLRQTQVAGSRDLRVRRAFLFVKRIWHLAKV
jgi:PAP2 superfamily